MDIKEWEVAMKCLNCGDCCKYMIIWVPINENTDVNDFIYYLNCHGCKVNVENNIFSILIPNICNNLKFNNNKYSCSIHSNKPKICKNFLCKKWSKEVKGLEKKTIKTLIQNKRRT
jgi:Fe-S-cluster containining protein